MKSMSMLLLAQKFISKLIKILSKFHFSTDFQNPKTMLHCKQSNWNRNTFMLNKNFSEQPIHQRFIQFYMLYVSSFGISFVLSFTIIKSNCEICLFCQRVRHTSIDFWKKYYYTIHKHSKSHFRYIIWGINISGLVLQCVSFIRSSTV